MRRKRFATGHVLAMVLWLCVAGCGKQTAPPPSEQANQPASVVLVPAGEFTMGSQESYPTERPPRKVYLDAFYVDKYEVTNAEYQAFVKATGRPEPMGIGLVEGKFVADFRPWRDSQFNKPNQPVVCVGWEDAEAYAKWAGKRLPTEAEWEKAARGATDARAYPWGDDAPDCTLANADNCEKDTTQVGSYPTGASPYGVMDMAGNVFEWTNDWYSAGYYYTSPDSNPQGPTSGMGWVLRGGAFEAYWQWERVAKRYYRGTFDFSNVDIGFRCAAAAPGP